MTELEKCICKFIGLINERKDIEEQIRESLDKMDKQTSCFVSRLPGGKEWKEKNK